jgi:hypothetical protein
MVLAHINQDSRLLPVLNESNYLGIGLSYDTFSIDFYNSVTFKEEGGGGEQHIRNSLKELLTLSNCVETPNTAPSSSLCFHGAGIKPVAV